MARKKYISGIYNWCDRWCERCPYVSRCEVGAAEAAMPTEANDINNEAFWKVLAEAFAKTEKLLHKMAKAQGFDLNDISQEEREQTERKLRERAEQSRQHPVSVLSTDYLKAGHEWLLSPAIREKADDAVKEMKQGLRTVAEGEQEAIQMKECLDIVRWYLHFIPVKCSRAVAETHNRSFWEQLPPSERSYNGTAKMALIAIERSIKAWALLLDMMPGEEDTLIGLLATLQRLQRLVEEAFPDARSFVRPGFDD
jgi:hypothetical protein